MDVMGAIDLLKKYELYNDAQNECKRKKIDEAPYDMKWTIVNKVDKQKSKIYRKLISA